MIAPLRARRTSRAFLVLLIVAFVGLVTRSDRPVLADGGRTVTVTPATNLGAQVVQVKWSGFDPTDFFGDFAVQVYECKANPKTIDADNDPATIDDCLSARPFPDSANGNAVFDGSTGDDGTGAAYFEIRTEYSTDSDALQCSSTVPCSLVVFEADGNPIPADSLPVTAVVVPLQFAKGATDCASVQDFDVRAEGEASAAQLLYGWAGNLCSANPKLVLDYTESSSNQGRDSLEHGQVDAAITSLPPTADELAAAGKQASDFKAAPLVADAIVVGFNMTDPVTLQRISDITLSPRLVARLVTNTRLLSFFDDPEFQALNPGHNWPVQGAAPPLLRAEQNADTRIVTDWFAHDPATQRFIAGTDDYSVPITTAWKNFHYPVDLFEDLTGGGTQYLPRTGEYNASVRVFYGVFANDNTRTRTTNFGFFGVMDREMARRLALPVAKIVNQAGNAVLPDDANLNSALAHMHDDGQYLTPNLADTTADAYPLTKVDHVMLAKSYDAAKSAKIAQVLKYAANTTQSGLPSGVLELPASLETRVAALATAFTPPPTTSTTIGSTTTTETPTTVSDLGTTVPFDSGGDGSGTGDATGDTTDTTAAGGVVPGGATTTTVRKRVTVKAPGWTPISAFRSGGGAAIIPTLFLLAVAGLALRFLAMSRRRVQALRAKGATS